MSQRPVTPGWFSINDLRARWSCSRSMVYRALGEMERGGYLRRLFIGADQRVALESVETWERSHSTPAGQTADRVEAIELRQRNARKRRGRVAGSAGGVSIRDAWRKMKAAA